jgi:hypothetical protein
LPNRALLALGGLVDERCHVHWSATMEPRGAPKRGLGPVAHRDGGSRVENRHIRLATRVP